MRCVFAFCCARAATDHVAETVIPLMKSRRRIACPEAQDHANDPDYIRDLPQEKWGSEAWLHGSKLELRMSALGQKQTFECVCAMSALPPKADIGRADRDVCFVPKADIAFGSRGARSQCGGAARAFAQAAIRSVGLIVQPGAKDAVSELVARLSGVHPAGEQTRAAS